MAAARRPSARAFEDAWLSECATMRERAQRPCRPSAQYDTAQQRTPRRSSFSSREPARACRPTSASMTIQPRRSRSRRRASSASSRPHGRRSRCTRCAIRSSSYPRSRRYISRPSTSRTGRFASGTGNPRSTTHHISQLSGGDSARPVARSTSRVPIRVPRGSGRLAGAPEAVDARPRRSSLGSPGERLVQDGQRASAARRRAQQINDDPFQAEDRQSVTFVAIVVEPAGVVDDDALPGRACDVSYGTTRWTGVGGKCGESVQVRS